MDVEMLPRARARQAGRDRRRPHIYTQEELDALLAACRMAFSHELVKMTMATVIALLAATGMRIGEALRMRSHDINAEQAVVLVRASKHSPDRLVPIHHSTLLALQRYQCDPDRLATGATPDGPLFVSTTGTAYRRTTVEAHFDKVRRATGLVWTTPAPRLHDLRHTFATRQMIRAYTTDGDPAATLALLANWLGHTDPSHTYWYIQAVPELLALAANRMNTAITME